MIRRPHLAALAVLAATLVGTSCSTTKDNGYAARVGDVSLSTDDVATMVRKDDATGANTEEFLQGDPARAAITKWVRVVVLEQQAGITSDQPGSIENLDGRLSTALTALTTGDLDATGALYDQGPATSGAVCLGAIPVGSPDQGAEVVAAIAAGTSFADAAKQYSTDQGLAGNGGIVTDNNGSECLAAQQISPDLAKQLEGVPVGTPTVTALQGQNQQPLDVVVMVRPWASLSDDAKKDVALVTNSSDLLPEVVAKADVKIDSRYGWWNKETGEVLAFGA